MKLLVGETKTITLCARDKKGGDTIIDVLPGEAYSFKVLPGQLWTDWFKVVDANGFTPGFLFPQPRLKGENYFCLCGLIETGTTETLFKIGKELPNYEIQLAGKLYYFANDYKYAYFNNKGSLQFEVNRKK